jgi:hypothetical protein
MTELGAVETGAPSPAAWVPADTFADRLARIRRVKGWNFMEAGRETGLSGKSWRLWEQHNRQPYNLLEIATKISEASGVSLIWLLTGSDDTSTYTVRYLATYLHSRWLAASNVPLDTSRLVPAA